MKYRILALFVMFCFLFCACEANTDVTKNSNQDTIQDTIVATLPMHSAVPNDTTQATQSVYEIVSSDFPLLLLDTREYTDQVYILGAVWESQFHQMDDYTYNEQKLLDFLRTENISVNTPAFETGRSLTLVDTEGNIATAVASGVTCSGRMIDEHIEVKAKLDAHVGKDGVYLGSYSETNIFISTERTAQAIYCQLDGSGEQDCVSWEFSPAQEIDGTIYYDYTLAVTRNGVQYVMDEEYSMPLLQKDLHIWLVDINLDGEAEIAVYDVGYSRFGDLDIYSYHDGRYEPFFSYVVSPEP